MAWAREPAATAAHRQNSAWLNRRTAGLNLRNLIGRHLAAGWPGGISPPGLARRSGASMLATWSGRQAGPIRHAGPAGSSRLAGLQAGPRPLANCITCKGAYRRYCGRALGRSAPTIEYHIDERLAHARLPAAAWNSAPTFKVHRAAVVPAGVVGWWHRGNISCELRVMFSKLSVLSRGCRVPRPPHSRHGHDNISFSPRPCSPAVRSSVTRFLTLQDDHLGSLTTARG
jgi:hypothetical protein